MSFRNLILYFPFSQTQLPKQIELTLALRLLSVGLPVTQAALEPQDRRGVGVRGRAPR